MSYVLILCEFEYSIFGVYNNTGNVIVYKLYKFILYNR